jgi:MFS family permease
LHADQNLASPNLSAIADEFGFDVLEKDRRIGGQVQLGFFFVGGITSLGVGPLADRLNRVNLLFVVVLFGSFPCLLVGQIPGGPDGFFWFFGARVLTGVSVGGSFPLLYSLCGDVCLPSQRAMISAAMGVATAAGVATGQLTAGFLGPRFGWRAPFVVVAYPAIATAALLWLTVPDPRFARKNPDDNAAAECSPLSEKGARARDAMKEVVEAEVAEEAIVQQSAPRGRGRELSRELEDGRRDEEHVDSPNNCDNVSKSKSHSGEEAHGKMPSDCRQFQRVTRVHTNRLLLCQGLPACVSWSTVTTFIPDYLHSEQGLPVESATLLVASFGLSCLVWALAGAAFGQRTYGRSKGALATVMALCTALAVAPFLLLINSPPALLHGGGMHEKDTPSAWAFLLTVLGGCAAVASPNVKGLLMNVNTAGTRGTVFAVVTLTDDVGKGLGPEFVALGVFVMGRRIALSMAMGCWLLSAACLYCTRWTIQKDVQRVEMMEKGVEQV